MKIVILDYQNSKVVIERLPKELWSKQAEEVEKWLIKKGYKKTQIEWMYGNLDISLNF